MDSQSIRKYVNLITEAEHDMHKHELEQELTPEQEEMIEELKNNANDFSNFLVSGGSHVPGTDVSNSETRFEDSVKKCLHAGISKDTILEKLEDYWPVKNRLTTLLSILSR